MPESEVTCSVCIHRGCPTPVACKEISRLRIREAALLGIIRHYNPDDAVLDFEKEQPNAGK